MTLPVILVNQFWQIITNGGKIVANVDPSDCGCCEPPPPPNACLYCSTSDIVGKTAKMVLAGSVNHACATCALLDGTYLAPYLASFGGGGSYGCEFYYGYPAAPAPFRACSHNEIYLHFIPTWNSLTDISTLAVQFYADSIPTWSTTIAGRVDCNSIIDVVLPLTYQNLLPGSACDFTGSTVTVSLI